MSKTNNLNKHENTPVLPSTYEEAIQYISDIRERWKVNQRHCDPTYPELQFRCSLLIISRASVSNIQNIF